MKFSIYNEGRAGFIFADGTVVVLPATIAMQFGTLS